MEMDYKEALEIIESCYVVEAYRDTPEYLHEAKSIAIEALKKQVPKEPKVSDVYSFTYDWTCPTCGRFHQMELPMEYCSKCGQRLDWNKG